MSDKPTVEDLVATFGDLDDDALAKLHDDESAEDNPRSTLLAAIHAEQDRRKAAAADAKAKADADAKAEKAKAKAADEIARLKAEIAELKAAVGKAASVPATPQEPGRPTVTAPGRRGFRVVGPRVNGSEEVLAQHGKLRTYRATAPGIDHKQGFIPEGTIFATTQPKGSWMEPVD